MIGTVLVLAGLALTCTVTAVLLALATPGARPVPRLRPLFRRAPKEG